MNTLAWILSGLLASGFLFVGVSKLITPYDKLRQNPQMAWVNDFSSNAVKGIGVLEILGALGVILPWALDIAPVLTPLAAVGLALLMVGAAMTHRRRGELKQVLPINGALFTLAAVVAVIRFSQL